MTGKKEDEFWDVYTEERIRTGRLHRRGDKMKEGEYHMVVHVCIFNSRRQLLVQQRQPFKKGWPNLWDVSVGGSAVSGDSSAGAAEREVWEELGLKMDFTGRRPNFTMNFSDGFDDYYIVEQDVDIEKLCLQKEEVQKVRWVDKEEALRMREAGIMIPYWFLEQLFEIGDVHTFDAHGDRRAQLKIGFAQQQHLESWMSLAEIVRWNFPGLETDGCLEDYKLEVVKNMERRSAICALDGNIVVGILLFSKKHNMIGCMAVHPEYRRKDIAGRMVRMMLAELDTDRDVIVDTFREEDERGTAPRAFYQKMGFVPGELGMAEGHPVQRFVLKR